MTCSLCADDADAWVAEHFHDGVLAGWIASAAALDGPELRQALRAKLAADGFDGPMLAAMMREFERRLALARPTVH